MSLMGYNGGRYSHIGKFFPQHVPNNEYIQLERIVRNRFGQFGRILVPAQGPGDEFRRSPLLCMYGCAEIREVVPHPRDGTRDVSGGTRIVTLVRRFDRMETFGIHRVRIHQKVVHNAVTIEV